MSDHGLTHLRKLPNLKVFNLEYFPITGDRISRLTLLQKLTSLDLCRSRIAIFSNEMDPEQKQQRPEAHRSPGATDDSAIQSDELPKTIAE